MSSHATSISTIVDYIWIPNISQYNNQLKIELNHFWQIHSNLNTKLEFSNVFNDSIEENFWTHILNLTFQLNLKNKISQLYLTFQNLLDEQYFVNYQQGLYSNVISKYLLNPRRIILGVSLRM